MPLVPFEALCIMLFVLGMGVHLAVMGPSLLFISDPSPTPSSSSSASAYSSPPYDGEGNVDELRLLAANETDIVAIGKRRPMEWLVVTEDICDFDWAAAGRVFSVMVLVVHVVFWGAALVECWVRRVRLRNSAVDPRTSRRYRWGF
jgi:hypothetical protein